MVIVPLRSTVAQTRRHGVVAALAGPLAEEGEVAGAEVDRVERQDERCGRLGIADRILARVVGLTVEIETVSERLDRIVVDPDGELMSATAAQVRRTRSKIVSLMSPSS